MAEVTGMTPDRISQEITNKTNAAIGPTTFYISRTDTLTANQIVRLNSDGKLYISTASITGLTDPVNKSYVDNAIGATTQYISYVDDRFANQIVRLSDKGKLFISNNSITAWSDPVNKAYVDNAILESKSSGGQTSWWN